MYNDNNIFWTLGCTNTLELKDLDNQYSNTLCLSMYFISKSMWILFNYGMEEFKNYLIDCDIYDESDPYSDITK